MKKIILVSCFFVVIIGSILLTYTITRNKLENKEKELKKEIISLSKTLKLDSLNYTNVVNDLYTEKELTKKLQKDNDSLYKKVKEYTLLYYGSLTVGSDTVKSETIITDTVYKDINIHRFYPNTDNPYIEYKALISGNKLYDEFILSPFNLDYVISSDKNGIKRITFNTPYWMKVEDVLLSGVYKDGSTVKVPRFTFNAGGGILFIDNPNPYISVGLLNKSISYDLMFGKDFIGLGAKINLFSIY